LSNFRTSWQVVLACTVGNAVGMTPMVYTVFGLFLLPISAEFHWPRSAVSIVLLIVAVAGAIGYPIVGRTIDRYGARVVVLSGIVAFAVAVSLVALINANRLELYAAYALIGITGTIPSSVTFTKLIAGWFDRHRGLALGIVGGLGHGIGSAVSPLYAQALIGWHGWRAAYVGLAAAILCIGLPVLYLLLRDPPSATRGSTRLAGSAGDATLAEARAGRTFWIILLAIALGAGSMTAVFAHVVPILTDRGLVDCNSHL
jgi:MFS family permease